MIVIGISESGRAIFKKGTKKFIKSPKTKISPKLKPADRIIVSKLLRLSIRKSLTRTKPGIKVK